MYADSSWCRWLSVGLWVCGVLLWPSAGLANVGPPSTGGQVVAEPLGVIDVAIQREILTIDLRPLSGNGLARVEAVYQLQNNGAEKKLDLLFASGTKNIEDFQVWLDDVLLPSTPASEKMQLPSSWHPPEETPGIHDERGLRYLPSQMKKMGVTPIAFSATIAPGSHQLKVAYKAESTLHHRNHPLVYQQFGYVLAPARAWAGFGGLDVSIQVPENWLVACSPQLQREGDTLRGQFAELPADTIALTLQAPVGPLYQPVKVGSQGLLIGVCCVGLIVCVLVGWRLGRRRASVGDSSSWLARSIWPWSAAVGILFALAILGSGLLAVFSPDWYLPAEQISHYGYGQIFALIGVWFLAMLAVPVGFGLTQLTGVLTRSRSRASAASAAVSGVAS